jgi:hypothetical protein
VFEGGLEGMGGIGLGIAAEKLQSLLQQQESIPSPKVAEEMLLCEVVQYRIC